MFVERSTQYTSFSSRKQPANAGTERKQFTENASVALQQPILTHAYTKCPPVLRDKTSYVLIIYLFSYVTYWKVYEGAIVGIAYSSEIFNRWLFLSGLALWFVPLVASSHIRLRHVYNR